jgi:hypothetical protein
MAREGVVHGKERTRTGWDGGANDGRGGGGCVLVEGGVHGREGAHTGKTRVRTGVEGA